MSDVADKTYSPWTGKRKRSDNTYSPWAGKKRSANPNAQSLQDPDVPRPKKFLPWAGKRSSARGTVHIRMNTNAAGDQEQQRSHVDKMLQGLRYKKLCQ